MCLYSASSGTVEYHSDTIPDTCEIERYFDLTYGWSPVSHLIISVKDIQTFKVTVHAR